MASACFFSPARSEGAFGGDMGVLSISIRCWGDMGASYRTAAEAIGHLSPAQAVEVQDQLAGVGFGCGLKFLDDPRGHCVGGSLAEALIADGQAETGPGRSGEKHCSDS
jgi:hypothetical protein